ncbi:hypothetical protein J2W40_001647 [Sphingobium xenophagum]|uniref:Uncharacterized protein n=1 Tax=Sphingobium xenophagum TaxID=121428 RepID=A0ABU1X1A4_SPHXE|nr:hypothetical protein [Sphingobium xenophagum]MDR7154832.1 hypothetical protein [Sphingobium xenophagum]
MTMVQPIALASDRVMAALKSGLELEFGRGAGEALAARFLEAEETDIRWDARARERWVGAYITQEEELELDRIVATGFLDGRWFVGMFIVDGDGNAHGMLCCRTFACDEAASQAFTQMR